MKQLFKHFALLVMGALISGCAAEVDDLQPTTNGTVTMKTTISLSEQASTRALTEAGVKTFEVGDKIAVIYKNTSDETVKVESTALTATDIDATDAHKATFSVSLTNPKASTPVRYIYPAAMAVTTIATDAAIDDAATIDYTKLATQDGTLTTLANTLDLSVFDGSLTSEAALPNTTTLANQLTIGKFTITNSDGTSDLTSTITSLTINDGTNIYIVNPSALSTIYVAMKPTSDNIATTATTTDSKTYFKTATGNTLAAGNLYSISVSMVSLAVGNILCSDGSVYASKDAATTAGKTPVAMICYLGNDAETSPTNTAYKHGLALALSDANGGSKASWCSQTSATCMASQYDDKTAAITDMAGIDNTDYLITHVPDGHNHYAASAARNYKYDASVAAGAHPTGTSAWFLPSAGQWNLIQSLGNPTLRTSADVKTDESYWPSTEYSGERAWYINLYHTLSWSNGFKSAHLYVRSVLAF